MKKSGKRSGFSLLELLAVVTILGIIASIIVPRVTVSSDTAKQKVRAHHIGTLNASVERFYIDNGTWPDDAAPFSAGNLDSVYLPDGAPTDPTGVGYTYNATKERFE
ncbi:type II secretion system protein [Adhaeretor mobilis]|uniref:Type II secretion system protein G n=1 Tax=Adhaeretor mobilis TaxID=1930276 RepID=A0A517MX16_9BACT|nr:prepilin-type N-terminal cleavage/methylation domain-containing protein [Adhaeretor mobilis]QDS99357.1 Type II secretion system protein G precursor [Adhaeretor mobilis]